MKKIFIVIAFVSFGAWTLTSCGSKKDESKENTEESADDYQAEKPATASTEDLIAQGKVLVDASDCKTCHHPINKIIGPAHTDVAKKYEFTQANVTMLADKIIAGGSGVWGQIPMSPHGDVSKADAEKMAMYVLSLDGEKMK
jgi:cytochrome c